MTDHDKFDELIPVYALGALEGDELKEIEDHLRGDCPLCRENLGEMEKVVCLIPYSLPPTSPSLKVKDSLLGRIKPKKQVRESYDSGFRQRLRPVWFGLAWAMALILLITQFITNLSLRGAIEDKQLEIAGLKERVNRQSQITQFLENPNVVIINLVGLEPRLEARGRVLWDTKRNTAFFYGLHLPKAPSGKTYQLWVIADNSPKSAGIFKVDKEGNNVMKLDFLPEPFQIQKFAVTLEPEGGLPQPTGEMYLVGDT